MAVERAGDTVREGGDETSRVGRVGGGYRGWSVAVLDMHMGRLAVYEPFRRYEPEPVKVVLDEGAELRVDAAGPGGDGGVPGAGGEDPESDTASARGAAGPAGLAFTVLVAGGEPMMP